MNKGIFAVLAILAASAIGYYYFDTPPASEESATGYNGGTSLVIVKVPDLSPVAKVGKGLFDENCAACHGVNASGRVDTGPPLVHKIYEPNHHGDMAFVLAAKNGVRAHHWRFGNMPPVEGITQAKVEKIVVYVRELQRKNGI